MHDSAELERIWKEEVVAYSRYYPNSPPRGTKESHENIKSG
jgi:hypothetical protein